MSKLSILLIILVDVALGILLFILKIAFGIDTNTTLVTFFISCLLMNTTLAAFVLIRNELDKIETELGELKKKKNSIEPKTTEVDKQDNK